MAAVATVFESFTYQVLNRYNDEEIIVFNANIALEVGFMKSRGLNVLLLNPSFPPKNQNQQRRAACL